MNPGTAPGTGPELFDRYVLPGDRVFPEGITAGQDGRTFYVSGARDGAIYRGRLDRPALEIWREPGADGGHLANYPPIS